MRSSGLDVHEAEVGEDEDEEDEEKYEEDDELEDNLGTAYGIWRDADYGALDAALDAYLDLSFEVTQTVYLDNWHLSATGLVP